MNISSFRKRSAIMVIPSIAFSRSDSQDPRPYCGRNSPAVGKSTMGDQRSGPSRREGPKDNTALRANERAGLT